MNFAVLTLFPEMLDALTCYGVSGRAADREFMSVTCVNPRDYTSDKHQTVDGRPYGGGPGMVMMVEPLKLALGAAKKAMVGPSKVIYMSPQGRPLDQAGVRSLSQEKNLVIIAGRYEGVDERFIESEVDEEWSIGDYVLSGGELPAMVLIDALVRQIPGVLGDESSASQDSFEYGLLDCPHYTRPENFEGKSVPSVLLSGDHKQIAKWRMEQSLVRTAERRPDLLEKLQLDDAQKQLLEEYHRGLGQNCKD